MTDKHWKQLIVFLGAAGVVGGILVGNFLYAAAQGCWALMTYTVVVQHQQLKIAREIADERARAIIQLLAQGKQL